MSVIRSTSFILLSMMSSLAFAQAVQDAALKNLIQSKIQQVHSLEDINIEAIHKTPFGLLEVFTDKGDIIYADDKADYLLRV